MPKLAPLAPYHLIRWFAHAGGAFFLENMKPNVEAILKNAVDTLTTGSLVDVDCMIEEYQITSPIEQIFFAQWYFSNISYGGFPYLTPQYKVGKFKTDFYVDVVGYFVNSTIPYTTEELNIISSTVPKRIVELDGHDFHEKTKAQVEYDKKRERFITSQGYIIHRFAGTEIVRNPFACVFEILQQSRKDLEQAIRRFQYSQAIFNGTNQKH